MLGQTNAKIVTGGGETQKGDYYVRVFDYDGSLLDEKWLNDGDEYTLPENNPVHNNMIFDHWSSTEYITNNKITIDKNNVMIGAVYTTISGYSEFDIELNKNIGLNVTFNASGEKDWGDGTTDSNTTHTYSNYGKYTIIFKGNTLNNPVFGQSSYPNDNIYCKDIRLLNVTLTGNNILYNLSCLNTIILKGITTSNSIIGYCRALKAVIFDKDFVFNVNTFPISGDNQCLELILVPKGLTKLQQQGSYMYSLRSYVIPNGVTEVISFGYQWGIDYLVLPYTVTKIKGNFVTLGYALKKFICNSNNVVHEDFNGSSFLDLTSNYLLKDTTKLLPQNFTGLNVLTGAKSIESLTLPSGTTKIHDLCANNSNLKELILNEGLLEIGGIRSCGTLEYLKFPSTLTKIYSNSFTNNYSMKEYDFSELLQIPTLEGSCFTNQSSCKFDFKIMVPWDLYLNWREATNWVTVQNVIDTGEAATISFTSDVNFNTYVNNNIINNNIITWKGNTISYTCHDITNNIILQNQYNNISEGETVNIPVNFSGYNKISLSLGVNGLDVKFLIDNIQFNSTEDNGEYYINIIGSGKNITYIILGGDNYIDEIGTITTTGSDITETITLTAATTQSFVRPNLTANGTLGENAFAVSANSYGSSYVAYKAVDDSSSTSWRSYYNGNDYRDYIFYNPNSLKVSSINILFNSSYSTLATDMKIQGSYDNTNWYDIESVYSGSGSNRVLTLNNNRYYKYYKLLFKPYGSNYYVEVYNFDIIATEKIASI